MNKKIIIIAVVVILVGVLGFLIMKKLAGGPQSTGVGTTKKVTCTDPTCLAPRFLSCSLTELKMPFQEQFTYVISVLGIENGKCHYTSKVVDQNGTVVQSEVDCKVPKELVTSDVLGHFFGQDKASGKEAIKAQQDKIESDYCTKAGI